MAQITPFGVELTPGATLTFNNADGLAPGSTATLWMLDQNKQSPTVGQFVPAGSATVSADGKTVSTAAGAVKFTSIYFVAVEQPSSIITGRVVDCSGRPLDGATVNVLGRAVLTDATGSFAVGGITASNQNLSVPVEASFMYNGQLLTARASVFLVPGGVATVRPDLILFTSNCQAAVFLAGCLNL